MPKDISPHIPTIYINNLRLDYEDLVVNENATHWFIYFEFTLSSHDIVIEYRFSVGGVWVPLDRLALLTPYIALATTIILVAVATVVFVKHKKKKQ